MYFMLYFNTDDGDDSRGHLLSTEKPDLWERWQLPHSDATAEIPHTAAPGATVTQL